MGPAGGHTPWSFVAHSHRMQMGRGAEPADCMQDSATEAQRHSGLMARVVARDRDALGEFYDELSGILFTVALRMLGDPTDAEEVVQDAFVQMWEKANLYNADLGTPLQWMLRITRNRCVDRIRARGRRAGLVEALENEGWFESGGEGARVPEAGLEPEELERVRRALEQLPPDQSQALRLAFMNGLSHHDIAEALGVPLGTIKARIRRGMLKLRELLPRET